jgi:aerobic-type carbon monoxide dehydrogenase small subunit (CoxS/CutS family)
LEQRVIINGKALNSKLGVIVQTDSKHVVDIAGLHEWEDSIWGELIRVTGVPIR